MFKIILRKCALILVNLLLFFVALFLLIFLNYVGVYFGWIDESDSPDETIIAPPTEYKTEKIFSNTFGEVTLEYTSFDKSQKIYLLRNKYLLTQKETLMRPIAEIPAELGYGFISSASLNNCSPISWQEASEILNSLHILEIDQPNESIATSSDHYENHPKNSRAGIDAKNLKTLKHFFMNFNQKNNQKIVVPILPDTWKIESAHFADEDDFLYYKNFFREIGDDYCISFKEPEIKMYCQIQYVLDYINNVNNHCFSFYGLNLYIMEQ